MALLFTTLSLLTPVSTANGGSCLTPSLQGCFADPYQSPVGSRAVLNYTAALNDKNMSLDKCISLCCAAGYKEGALAGVENGGDCHCDKGFGPYTIPTGTGCNAPCTGEPTTACGGKDFIQVYGITSCPGERTAPSVFAKLTHASAAPRLQQCGSQGCTQCPVGDTCCKGIAPDAYKVPGGYGCAPPNSVNTSGCASGGKSSVGCCCGPGPSIISTTQPNVLIVGDSVSDGYIPYVQKALNGIANTQHGPDNTGGGCADGAGYGQLCMKYFVRTPTYELPPWDVITFNFGLHDGDESNQTYLEDMTTIADTMVATANATATSTKKAARLIYFLTTIPGGANSVPGEPVSPNDLKVKQLNEIATSIMKQRNIAVVDLYATMTACGDACKSCKPHCGPAGYQYLVDNAILPAIKKALAE